MSETQVLMTVFDFFVFCFPKNHGMGEIGGEGATLLPHPYTQPTIENPDMIMIFFQCLLAIAPC